MRKRERKACDVMSFFLEVKVVWFGSLVEEVGIFIILLYMGYIFFMLSFLVFSLFWYFVHFLLFHLTCYLHFLHMHGSERRRSEKGVWIKNGEFSCWKWLCTKKWKWVGYIFLAVCLHVSSLFPMVISLTWFLSFPSPWCWSAEAWEVVIAIFSLFPLTSYNINVSCILSLG